MTHENRLDDLDDRQAGPRSRCGERQPTGYDPSIADFLGPSRIGKSDQGSAMVELLNRSGLAYFVPGNHEFDYKQEVLADRLQQAHFKMLLSNVAGPS